jgi:hypothetical protein
MNYPFEVSTNTIVPECPINISYVEGGVVLTLQQARELRDALDKAIREVEQR